MKTIRILVVDDHALVREGIKAMLAGVDDFVITGEAENGIEAIDQLKKIAVDIVIMDISMPLMTGIEAIKIIAADFPAIKTIILTIHSEIEFIEQIYKSGATGCLYKNAGKSEFELAIRTIIKGERYFCMVLSDAILKEHFNKIENNNKNLLQPKDENPLTKREIEILKLLAEDMSNQAIADKLCISYRTIETHRKNIMQKLKLNSTIALVKYAIQKGIISI